MNKTQLSNPVRLIAFFLTAVILTCTFGFTVDGWQDSADNAGDDNTNQPNDDNPENNGDDIPTDAPPADEPQIHIPEFVSRITGIEISEDDAKSLSVALVINPSLPLYGLSSAELICDVPTEDGGRYIAFINTSTELWKIGSVSPTRGYISNIAKYFGGVLLSYGSDDSISYDVCDVSKMKLDLSQDRGYHYTEDDGAIYTNSDLLSGGILSLGINGQSISVSPLPYVHTDFGTEKIAFENNTAITVEINSEGNCTLQLNYDSESSTYHISKNGTVLTDAYSEKELLFENCFVLFADSAIYDRVGCNQMVMDTIGEGFGYYITNGSFSKIKWTAASGGIMTFYSESGEKLTVNRGRNYITFIRSSWADKISFH